MWVRMKFYAGESQHWLAYVVWYASEQLLYTCLFQNVHQWYTTGMNNIWQDIWMYYQTCAIAMRSCENNYSYYDHVVHMILCALFAPMGQWLDWGSTSVFITWTWWTNTTQPYLYFHMIFWHNCVSIDDFCVSCLLWLTCLSHASRVRFLLLRLLIQSARANVCPRVPPFPQSNRKSACPTVCLSILSAVHAPFSLPIW